MSGVDAGAFEARPRRTSTFREVAVWGWLTLQRLAVVVALAAASGFGARENLFGTVDARAWWSLGCLAVMAVALAMHGGQRVVTKQRSSLRNGP